MNKNGNYKINLQIADGYWKRAIVYLLNVGSFMFVNSTKHDLSEFIDFTGDHKPQDGMDLLEFVRYFQNKNIATIAASHEVAGDDLKVCSTIM